MMSMFILYANDAVPAPSVNLSFAGGTLPAGTSFARASSATCFGNAGTLQTALTDAARFDYDPVALTLRGLLAEAQSTNYALNGSASASSGSSLATNQANSLTGNSDALLFTEPASGTAAPQLSFGAASITSGNTYTGSIYFLPVTCNRVQLLWSSSVGAEYANFYLNGAGSVTVQSGAAASITALPNGWYRAIVTFAATGTNAGTNTITVETLATGSEGRAPTITASGRSYYAFGGQFEKTAAPTSYIPTTTSAATRAADALSFTIPSGIGHLTYTFDDGSTQAVSVSAGAYTVPTNLNRPWIKSIMGSA
jgi:hypothetical protein